MPVAEQVIEVPKIILENIAVRTLVREPQLAEQLVEVPTILTPPFLLSGWLQNVDTPVPHGGRGASGGLPEQNATAFGEADHRFQQRLPTRSLISPFLVEGFKIYAQDRVLRLVLRMTHFKGFSHFSQVQKSATPPPHSGSELPPHSSPWTLAAYDVPMALEEEEESEEELDFDVEYGDFDGRWRGCEWVPARQQYSAADGSRAGHTTTRILVAGEGQEWYFLVCSSGLPSYPVAWSSRWCRLCVRAALCQPTAALEEFPLLRQFARAVRTRKAGHFSFALVSFGLGPVFGCCLWSTAFWTFREILRARHLVRQ